MDSGSLLPRLLCDERRDLALLAAVLTLFFSKRYLFCRCDS